MSENIRNTMQTPGWKEIVEKAAARIRRNMHAAMATRDEAEALKAHRAAWAAEDALQEFLYELEIQESNEHSTD